MNFLRHYFIGDYLHSEPDVLKQASIRLVYNVVTVSIASLILFFGIYLSSGNYYQLVKCSIILVIFTGVLFYIRRHKSIRSICHLLIVVSWCNNLANIVLFDNVNFIVALLTVCNVIFAFHTLGSRTGIFYSWLHFLPITAHFILKRFGLTLGGHQPLQLTFMEMITTLVVVSFIIVYLIYHYHQAYEVAHQSIQKGMDELKRAKDLAEEMNRLKSNFLSNMSHEIRTPINGILGLSKVIEMETKDPDIHKYVHLQQQSGQRLLNTITSILELSRIDASRHELKLKVVDINQLVKECIEPLEQMALSKHLEFHVHLSSEELKSLSDETILFQVINNIVGNAIKFTEKGRIVVSTGLDTEKPTMMAITVTDTGVGISPDFFGKIFTPFAQESTGRSRSHEGTGLGLSISKSYVELLGGSIRVQSVKGSGSTFQIVLPIYV